MSMIILSFHMKHSGLLLFFILFKMDQQFLFTLNFEIIKAYIDHPQTYF